jgi:hypothetical protein
MSTPEEPIPGQLSIRRDSTKRAWVLVGGAAHGSPLRGRTKPGHQCRGLAQNSDEQLRQRYRVVITNAARPEFSTQSVLRPIR